MRKLGFFGTAILLQVLILLVPGHYTWANVGGLFVFALVYCWHGWLEYCSSKENKDTIRRLEILEKETQAINAAMQWKEQ